MHSSAWFPFSRSVNSGESAVVCFPFAGGGASYYRRWATQESGALRVLPIQLPGREGRISEEPFSAMDVAAAAVTLALLENEIHPVAFFGHSFGAILAVEVLRQLQERNAPRPRNLFVSAARPPHLWPMHSGRVLETDAQLVDYLRSVGHVPEVLLETPEMRSIVLQSFRGDMHVCATYSPTFQEPLECEITVFGGTHDPNVPVDSLQEWGRWSTSQVDIHTFDGDHFYLDTTMDVVMEMIVERVNTPIVTVAEGASQP